MGVLYTIDGLDMKSVSNAAPPAAAAIAITTTSVLGLSLLCVSGAFAAMMAARVNSTVIPMATAVHANREGRGKPQALFIYLSLLGDKHE